MKILNLDNWCDEAKGMLDKHLIKKLEDVKCIEHENDRYSYPELGGIILRLNDDFGSEMYKHCPNLKFIASCTTGLDHIDLDYCKAKGIKVISLQGETDFLRDVWATAEHTWGLILSLVRKIPFAFDDVKQGNWEREKWQGTELRGKTLGIVGYGRVGQQVSKFAEAFGMQVIAHNDWLAPYTYREMYYNAKFTDCSKEGLEMLLRCGDIVTVHVPLNSETRGMFTFDQFRLMKRSAYFINASRGPIVRDNDLLLALDYKEIKGAAVDVLSFESEPTQDNEWDRNLLVEYAKRHENLIITPHMAGNTAESREKTQIHIAQRIKEYINGL